MRKKRIIPWKIKLMLLGKSISVGH